MTNHEWYSKLIAFNVRKAAWFSIGLVLAISILNIAGWIFNTPLLKSGNERFIAMKMISAICMLFSALALIFVINSTASNRNILISRILINMVILIGIVSMITNSVFLKSGLELFPENTSFFNLFLGHSNRMYLLTSIQFIIVGFVILLLTFHNNKLVGLGHILLLPVFISSYFFPVSYIIGSYTIFEYRDMPIAMYTGVAFFFLCMGVFCFRPSSWIMRVFNGDYAGSEMARRLFPWVLIIPLLIGWFRVHFEKNGLLTSEVGVAIVAVTYTFCFFWLVWITAKSVNKTDEKRRLIEDLKLKSEERYKNLFEYSVLPIWEEDLSLFKIYLDKLKDTGIKDFRAYLNSNLNELKYLASLIKIVDVNHKNITFFNVNSKEEIITNPLYYFKDESIEVLKEKVLALAEGKTYFESEMPLKLADGNIKYVLLHLSVMQGYESTLDKVLVTFIDITDRKRIEKDLLSSREEWVETFNLIPDLIAILDDKHRIVKANRAMSDKLCLTQQETTGIHCYKCVHGTDSPPASCPHSRMLADNKQHITEIHEINLGGDYLVSVTPILDDRGNFKGGVHVARDITDRKKKEQDLEKLNLTLKALSKSSQAMVRFTNEHLYLEEICRIIAEDCGHAMVWIGFAENDEGKTVNPIAYAGFEKGYLETLKITWEDNERGHGPTGTTIRTGKPSMCRNMLTDPLFEPWREEALKRGYASSLALPLTDKGRVFGALSIYSKDPDPFSLNEVSFLTEIANDLAFGVVSIRSKIAQAEAENELRKSEQRLKYHFENSPLAIIEWDANFIVSQWSSEAERIFGWNAGETVGKSINSLNMIYVEDIPIVNHTIERLCSGAENPVVSTNRNYTKSGSVIQCTWYNSILLDEEGNMASVMSLIEDITEQRLAEDTLRTNEALMSLFVENAPAAIAMLDDQMRYIRASKKWFDDFGLQDTNIIGRSHYEIFPEITGHMKEIHRRCLSGEVLRNNDDAFVRIDGHIDWLSWEIRPWYKKKDEIGGIIIFSQNITDQKLIEVALEKNAKRLAILSENASSLLESDNPQKIVNELCRKVMEFLDCQIFFNYIVDEEKGKLHLNAFAGISDVTAKEIEWLELGSSVCGCVASGKSRIIAENIQETPDPRTELIKSFGVKAYACHPLMSQDKVIGTLSFGTNSRTKFNDDDIALMKMITDQVSVGINRVRDELALLRSEEQYRKLVEISPYAVFINRNNRITYVNPAAIKLLGATTSDQLIGKSPFDIFPPEIHSIEKERINTVFAGKSISMIELKIVRLNGILRDVEVTGSKFSDQEGEAIQVILRDITENKQAQAIKERYQLITEYARDPLLLIGTNGKIIEANRAAVELYGYTYDELLSLKIHNLRKEKDGIIDEQMLEAKEKGILFETEHIRKDGQSFPVEVSSRCVTINEVEMLLSVIRDITERKKNENALNEQAKMLEYAPVLVRNLNDEIIMWNSGMEKILGFNRKEALGKVSHDLLHTEYPVAIEKIFKKLYRYEKWEGELQHKQKDGQPAIVLSSWMLHRDELGNPLAIIEVSKDITKRKKAERDLQRSEEKLKLALDNGSIGVWEWDITAGTIEWDERMEKIFGIEKGTFENSYNAFESFLLEEDVSHVRKAIEKALQEDVPFETIYRIMVNGGFVKYISAKAMVEKNHEGKPIKMTGICFDITEMKKGAEQSLFKVNEELLRSNKELEQFAYVASHDLQEPLRMVSSFTQLLAQRYKDKLDGDAHEFIQFAVDGASRMQVMINDLLAYSRVHTKGKTFLYVDMHEILAIVVNNLSVRIREKNALVTCDDLPTVKVDEGQMVQLFQNLIGNALKFCKNVPQVHVSSKEEADYYILSVRDNGIGIEPEYFERIFQIFQRLFPKNEYEGTGIGLAICKRIVERHGGKIWVESEQGKGTTFYFTILKK